MLRFDEERQVWVREWDAQASYTISTASEILCRSIPQVTLMVESGSLVGPGSTSDEPIDHDKLRSAAVKVGWRSARSDLRLKAERILKEMLHANSGD